MEHKKILNVLILILALSCVIVSLVIVQLYREIYYLPDKSADDIVKVLAESNITVDKSLVDTKRERGNVYVCSSGDYYETVAALLASSKVKYAFVIPDGELVIMENGSRFEFGSGFSFRYARNEEADSTRNDGFAFSELYERPSKQKIDEISAVVAEFMDRGSEEFKIGGSMDISTSVERVWEHDGKYYAICSRSIGGVEVNDNRVFCTVENGEVTAASGTWSFLTLGNSYSAQLCDSVNILFNVKKELGTPQDRVVIEAIEQCYALYTYGDDEDLCLLPCYKVVTNNSGELIYNAIDGTIYTRK